MIDPDKSEEENLEILLAAGVLREVDGRYTLNTELGEIIAPEFTRRYHQELYMDLLDMELDGYFVSEEQDNDTLWKTSEKMRAIVEGLPNG